MFQLTEEQVEEIQVLESIYGEAFKHDINNPTKYSIDLDTVLGTVTLKITLVPEYPAVLPEMEISSSSHKLVTHDLFKALKEEAEGQVGMAMVFTLTSFIEDWLAKHHKNSNKSVRLPKASEIDDEDASGSTKTHTLIEEKVLAEGTPVTRETFLAWKDRFLRENVGNLKGPASQFAPIQKESKLTGKQLFEQNKALAASDAAFADDGIALEIDETAFEGINLADFDDEEEEENVYDNRGQISDDE